MIEVTAIEDIEVKPMGRPTTGSESCNGCYSDTISMIVSVGRGNAPTQTMTIRLCNKCAATLAAEVEWNVT